MGTIEFQNERIRPGKIVCIGKNYRAHIEEMGSVVPEQMVVFMKPNSAITRTLRAVAEEPLHYECEICLLIKAGAIYGLGIGLDLTKRKLQGQLKAAGLPWERSKAFDGAALFSGFIPAPKRLDNLSFELQVNGEARQRGETTAMLYPPALILDELQRFLSLDDYDIVMTGTPAGVGPVEHGDRFEAVLRDGDVTLVEAQWLAP